MRHPHDVGDGVSPYRTNEKPPVVLDVERPWFPRVGEVVWILRRREANLVKDVGRAGIVRQILKAVYVLEMHDRCPACDGGGNCGRRLCHTTAGMFVLEELGEVARDYCGCPTRTP